MSCVSSVDHLIFTGNVAQASCFKARSSFVNRRKLEILYDGRPVVLIL
jgi:hypothetical protein